MPVHTAVFGNLPDGREVTQYTLSNRAGMEVRLLDYGGIITHLLVPGPDGKRTDVVLGFDELAPYLTDSPYFGALIGRFGNRIAGGRFRLDGTEYRLECNDGDNHLHGGVEGFDKKLWQGRALDEGEPGVQLSLVSPDGDQGYPGELRVEVTYRLTHDNRLVTDYRATTDRPTPVNLTQHSYFNLDGGGPVREHRMRLNARRYTPVNETLIPEGPLAEVAQTPFDFTRAKAIGADIDADHPQLERTNGGYDHNFVIDRDGHRDDEEVLAARAEAARTGLALEVWSQAPCFQFYTGNFLDGSTEGKGIRHQRQGAFCIEPQFFPDSPNQDRFPDTVLRPGEVYRSRMSFRFFTL